MKTKYVKRSQLSARSNEFYSPYLDGPLLPQLTVDDFINTPRFTGVLGTDGDEIIAIAIPETLGFLDFKK